MNCVNCGATIDTAYCPECGQKAKTKRLNLSFLWMDFQSRIYGFDGIFPRTLKDLTLRPGAVSNRFIDGNRILYVGPVGYFFLMIALSILLMESTNLDFNQMVKTTVTISNQTSKQEMVQRSIIDFIVSHFRLFRFLLIPVTTFWIWIFYRKKDYNYIECSVPAFYAQGHLEILFMINILLFYFLGFHFNQFSFVIEPAYYGLAFLTFSPTPKITSFLTGVIIWILSFISFVLIFGLVVLFWILNNAEILKQIKPDS